ncbi:hypothetical protein [Pseudorhodobacter wandonensis]|nr:hypothetical protein [Pseudorhodobacter wandonensis]
MKFDDAVLELKLRTSLDSYFLREALSNEIKEPTDTLRYARQIY